MTKKLELGKIYLSEKIGALMNTDYIAILRLHDCLALHESCIWGDLSEEDKQNNEIALEKGERILSSYEIDYGRIWIITEYDRTATTILFPDEY